MKTGVPFLNQSGLDIPPYAVVAMLDQDDFAPGRPMVHVTRQEGVMRPWLVNGPNVIPKCCEGHGKTIFHPQWMAYDPDGPTPAAGDQWGPVQGSWYLTDEGTGVWIIKVDSTRKLVYAQVLSQSDLGTTTTTTTTSTTTTPGSVAQCSGRCKFVWRVSGCEWVVDDPDACSTTTTTTTSTTSTTTSTTTTIAHCCAQNTTTTTTTTTSTTTTGQSCQCLLPNFCGSVDGECYYSSCAQIQTPKPNCDCSGTTTTTTTTTPGTTTTTSTTTTNNPNVGCTGGCDFFWGITTSGVEDWILVARDCADDCPCQSPTGPPEDGCGSTGRTPCQSNPPPPPCTPCAGTCKWMWSTVYSQWILVRNTFYCTRSRICEGSCGCWPPSFPGTSECGIATTPCGWPGTTTTTTTTPGTTTTSTTTTDPCDRRCRYEANASLNGWTKTDDPCPSGCACGFPATLPLEGCEVAYVPCGTGRTTTTTTTTTDTTTTTSTTTSAPEVPGACCQSFYNPSTPSVCYGGITYSDCLSYNPVVVSGVCFAEGATCSDFEGPEGDCPECRTTTTSTTTSAPTGACCHLESSTCDAFMTEADCEALGGAHLWLGAGEGCSGCPGA